MKAYKWLWGRHSISKTRCKAIYATIFQEISIHYLPLGEFVVSENEHLFAFEGFWECPLESIVKATVSSVRSSSSWPCTIGLKSFITLYKIRKILIVRFNVQKTEPLLLQIPHRDGQLWWMPPESKSAPSKIVSHFIAFTANPAVIWGCAPVL